MLSKVHTGKAQFSSRSIKPNCYLVLLKLINPEDSTVSTIQLLKEAGETVLADKAVAAVGALQEHFPLP